MIANGSYPSPFRCIAAGYRNFFLSGTFSGMSKPTAWIIALGIAVEPRFVNVAVS